MRKIQWLLTCSSPHIWGNWGIERVSNLPKVPQLGSNGEGTGGPGCAAPQSMIDLLCAYAQPHPGIRVPQTVLRSAIWAEPLALPCPSEIPTHRKYHWASAATPKSWALFKVRASQPASCRQNLMPTELGESRVECVAPAKNARDSHFSYSKLNSITLFKALCNWPFVSLQTNEMVALQK